MKIIIFEENERKETDKLEIELLTNETVKYLESIKRKRGILEIRLFKSVNGYSIINYITQKDLDEAIKYREAGYPNSHKKLPDVFGGAKKEAA